MDKMIHDEFLYANVPQEEKKMLEKIPPENELSHKFSRGFNRKMKALLKYERRTPSMRRFVHRMKIAATIFLVMLSLTFGTIMSVEAYRIRFFEFITQVCEELTSIVIHSDENAGHDTLALVFPTYVPDGYSILKQTSSEYKNSIIYCNESGAEIYYLQKLSSQSEFIFDSETVEPKEIAIGTHKGYIFINKGVTQIYWYDNFNVYSLIGSLDESEIIKMAESIQK
ncbi:MAG TPA: hypothetical protein DHW61_03755 [Lachnoclostridium phytofermentans]|uniref:DUF4367 domain-containing protein n=1 Tax=Lachnoclostridium phytofermentans TaxID=66219 RepID=A0A3D2X310_9FIRM|nr:DUF4367 domain-containing protein [Lachnoclostridium sp.]HCL01521.1 hypothetical protein [Lachnoclostridium phytofermentans]